MMLNCKIIWLIGSSTSSLNITGSQILNIYVAFITKQLHIGK